MCTLIVLHRCVPGRPLVVAANRDEFLDRPAEEPALRFSRTGPIVAPLDLEAGGTWVGVNARGVFAGLTNLRPTAERSDDRHSAVATIERASKERRQTNKPELRSRGEVVMMALESESAGHAVRTLSNLEVEAYNPFQLLVADGHEAWLVVYRGQSRAIPLEPGPHIVGNVVGNVVGDVVAEHTEAVIGTASLTLSPNEEPRVRKLTRIRERVEKLLTERSPDLLQGLGHVCREHVDADPFESTCVHVAAHYGTRSSLLLELAQERHASQLWTTDGPPCERAFEDLSGLLKELDARSRRFIEG